MQFSRQERFEKLSLSDRKIAAFPRKQQRERERYPLFPQHVAAEQHGLDDEISRRSKADTKTEERLRAFHNRVWRDSRKIYFEVNPELRAKIAEAWRVWTGPRTSTYFSSMVDVMSGNQAARLAVYRGADKMRRASTVEPEQQAIFNIWK